ncbi:MAG: alpha/beta fold hydrolase [Cellulosilyticaceae bacterium]
MNEKLFVEINDMKQGMFLQSENVENPVLLFLHGGPGSPEIAFKEQYPTGLEKIFTVCWWEQRGSGMSYNRKMAAEKITIDQMIADTIQVIHYLRERFKKKKVYIMGHSWGSLLGILTVQQVPELCHAYIGIGQVAKQLESERLAYDFMLQEFRSNNNQKMLSKLEKFPINEARDVSVGYLGVRSEGMMKLGIGVMHHWHSMNQCVMTVMRYKGYTLKEKLNFPMGSQFSLKCLWANVLKIDLLKQASELKVPVYIFHGKYDYQVSYKIAREYAQILKAPLKGFYTFENSAHSPCFEEAEKMCAILCEDVLQGKVDLAD